MMAAEKTWRENATHDWGFLKLRVFLACCWSRIMDSSSSVFMPTLSDQPWRTCPTVALLFLCGESPQQP